MKKIVIMFLALGLIDVFQNSYSIDYCNSEIVKFLVLGLIGVFQNSYSIDYCNSEIVKSWKVETEISAKEIHMATCCPPFDVDDFYIKHVKSTDPMGISITILKTYLKKNGIRLDPRHFFEGKQFCIKKEE